MAGDNKALQITWELYNDGVQKRIFFFFPSSYLTLHLASAASKVFKTSSASSCVFAKNIKIINTTIK
jgi:hypothetical protein